MAKINMTLYVNQDLKSDFETLVRTQGLQVSAMFEEWMSKYCDENRPLLEKQKTKEELIGLIQDSKSISKMRKELLEYLHKSGEKNSAESLTNWLKSQGFRVTSEGGILSVRDELQVQLPKSGDPEIVYQAKPPPKKLRKRLGKRIKNESTGKNR